MNNNIPTSVRIPKKLKDFIKEDAKNNRRSYSEEINFLIEKGIKVAEAEKEALENIKAGNTQKVQDLQKEEITARE